MPNPIAEPKLDADGSIRFEEKIPTTPTRFMTYEHVFTDPRLNERLAPANRCGVEIVPVKIPGATIPPAMNHRP